MAETSGYVVSSAAVEPEVRQGDTAEERLTIGRPSGSTRLEQRVIRFAPGRSQPRGGDGTCDVLYVVSGRGALLAGSERHELEPELGVYVDGGQGYEVDNPGPDALTVIAVTAPATGSGDRSKRRVASVRFGDQPELRADHKRTYRYLVNEQVGCEELTQFVGIVEPCRAPDHSHAYDEVGYVLEGTGIAHLGDVRTPIEAGSCFHLPPGKVHCIENSGPGVMRIMGVFHPSGSPASRSYEDNK